jgi:hypothetical protein
VSVYCQQCGSAASDHSAFCEDCGAPLPVAPSGTEAKSSTTSSGATATAPAPTAAAAAPLRGITAHYGQSRARSKAWIYYLILAICSLLAVFAGKPVGLLGTLLFGAYSYYLYQGGRVVIWFW